MKTITFNGHTLEMFDSIQDTRIKRFQLYNLNVMLDAGIGSDLNDVNTRINNITQLIGTKPEAAAAELHNLQQLIYFIMRNTSPGMNSFVAMIHRIDGREVRDEDLSTEGIAKILHDLDRKRMTARTVFEFLAHVKKKLGRELDTFFPAEFNTSAVKEFYSKLKRQTLLILQSILTGADLTDQIRAIDEFFLLQLRPRSFSGPQGAEVQTIKRFEEMCILLTYHQMTPDPKNMTTLAFFQALEVIKAKAKAQKNGRAEKGR